MVAVSIAEAEGALSELIDCAPAGENVEIMQDGQVVARLVAPPLKRPAGLGAEAGKLVSDTRDEG